MPEASFIAEITKYSQAYELALTLQSFYRQWERRHLIMVIHAEAPPPIQDRAYGLVPTVLIS